MITLNLNNKITGDYKAINTGFAYYVFLAYIPIIGVVVTLIISVVKKQFKLYFLNAIIWNLLLYVIVLILGVIVFSIQSTVLANFLGTIILIMAAVLPIVLMIFFAKDLNKVSIKYYLSGGYTLENPTNSLLEYVDKEITNKKYPFWVLIK